MSGSSINKLTRSSRQQADSVLPSTIRLGSHESAGVIGDPLYSLRTFGHNSHRAALFRPVRDGTGNASVAADGMAKSGANAFDDGTKVS